MRRAFPRSRERHELAATELLEAYARRFAWTPALPVPVERIVEAHVGLAVDWAELEDRPDARVLGALFPATRTIVLNTRHQDHYERWVGPYEFTLAHELGHWLYDAVPPSQLQLVADSGATVFCRGPSSPDAIREVNANRFAACLLLPGALVRAEVSAPLESVEALAALARRWCVSRRTLEIRLGELSLQTRLPSS